jgi:ribosomal protein S28E/S33
VGVERDVAAEGEEEDVTVNVIGQTGHEGEAEQMAVRGKPSRCLVASL